MDWDEELKRQAAISALLEAPEAVPNLDQPTTEEDWHKTLKDSFDQSGAPKFDTKTDEQVTALPEPPKFDTKTDEQVVAPSEPKFDTKTDEQVVPYGEREKPAPPPSPYVTMDTGKGAAPEAYPTVAQDQGAGEGSGQQAPDALTQVERATLVKLPPEVRRAELVDPDPDAQYLDPEVRRAAVVGTTPKAEPVQDPLAARSIAKNIADQAAVVPPKDQVAAPAAPATSTTQPAADWDTALEEAFGKPKTPEPVGVKPDSTGQDNSGVADYFRKRGDVPITSENDPRLTQINVGGSKFNVHQEAAPYFKGFLQELADQGAPMRSDGGWNYRQKVGAKGLSEHSWAGAIDLNQDGRGIVTPQFQRWLQDHPGALQAAEQRWHIYGGERFGDLGHFEWGGVPGEGGGGDKGDTLAQLKSSGLNVTTFGQPDDPYLDKDSAAGNGKHISGLIPGYDVALNAKARHIVGDPEPGQEFTYAGRKFRYGDDVPERYPDARFDVFDPYNTALATLGKGETAKETGPKKPWYESDEFAGWKQANPQDVAVAQKAQRDTLDKLNQSTQNPGEFWKTLNQHVNGISDDVRQQYADNWKKEVTKNAVDFYSQKGTLAEQHITPEEAFTRATSDPGFEAYVSNIGRGLAGAVGEADLGIAQMGKSIDLNRADGFMQLVHPESTGEGRAGFLKTLTDIQDKFEGHRLDDPGRRHRHDVFNEIYGNLPQNTKDAIGDPTSILDSIDNLADPKYQADLNKRIAVKKAWVDQQLKGNPELKGYGDFLGHSADWWTTGTGENIFNTVAALVPGGAGAVVRSTTFGSQMYSSNMDRIAAEHPHWSIAQVSDEAAKSTFWTLAPQEALIAASHGLMTPLLKWVGAAAEKPLVRFGIGGGAQLATGAVVGGAGQVGANIAENKPVLEGVPQAAGMGMLQAAPFAVHGGLHAMGEAPQPKPTEVKPVPTTRLAPEPPPEEPASVQRPVTRAEMLGPDEPPAPATPRPWYMQGAEPGQDPLVIRGAERTSFTPQELSDIVNRLPSDTTPAELKGTLDRIPSPAKWYLGDEGNVEAEQTRQMQGGIPDSTLSGRARDRSGNVTTTSIKVPRAAKVPVDLNTAIAQQRATAGLSAAPQVTGASERGNVQTVQKSGTGLQNVGQMGGAIAGNMREMLWNKFQAGDTTEAGGPSNLLRLAAREKAAGRVVSRQDFEDFVTRYGEHLKTKKPIQEFANSEAARTPGSTLPPRVSESDPYVSKIANRYTAERMATGELGQVDPSQGKSTEELVHHGLKMTPERRESLIDNFVKGKGGDLDVQGAAIRSKEAILSVQSTEASRASEADPNNQQLKAEANAASKAVTDFYNGPIKKLKKVWSDAGRGMQREVPLDYTTLNGMKEAYVKGAGNGKEAPPEMEKKLKRTAGAVKKSASDEQAALDGLGKEIEKQTRGKTLPNDDHIVARLMEIMKDLPCRN